MKKVDLILEKLLTSLAQRKIIKPIFSLDNFNYSDELKIYRYSIHTIQKSPYFKKNNLPLINKVDAGGVSSVSRREALLKCVSEYAERFSLYYYDKSTLTYTAYNALSNALNPRVYRNTDSIEKKEFAWVKGIDYMENKEIFIPSQLVYLYSYNPSEILLQHGISTGAASDFRLDKALLRGIYECVERDAFMIAYLIKAKIPRLDPLAINSDRVLNILIKAKRYNLELYLFDITSDINIPVYLTVLIDRTGLGPAVLIGTKASFNRMEAIIGSMEESFMGRSWIRTWMMKGKHLNFRKKNAKIETQLHRALYWARPEMIDKIDYLINQPVNKFGSMEYKTSTKVDLKKAKEILKNKGFKIYFTDITNDLFRKFGFVVVKTVIPGLQPLYLSESEKEIVDSRIKAVAKKFKIKDLKLNPVPHPFL